MLYCNVITKNMEHSDGCPDYGTIWLNLGKTVFLQTAHTEY